MALSGLSATDPTAEVPIVFTERDCAICGDGREFEQPPCPDGHDDCPDRACRDCGAAIVMGTWDPVAATAANAA